MIRPIASACILLALSGCDSEKAAKSGDDADQARRLIAQLTFDVPNRPRMGPLSEWSLSVDTFTNKVPSQSIEDLYHLTTAKLDELYPGRLKTYTWSDQMGYPRQVSFVQLTVGEDPHAYLATTAFENNDNDSYAFFTSGGEFPVPEGATQKDEAKIEGFLRCNN